MLARPLISLLIAWTSLLGSIFAQSREPIPQGELALGKAVEAKLESGDVHAWNLKLEAGQYAALEVRQDEFDGVVSVVRDAGDDGRVRFDFETAVPGSERGSVVVDRAEVVRFLVEPADGSRGGSYTIRLTVQRDATQEDRKRFAAYQAYSRARDFRLAGKYSEADPFALAALKGLEESLGPEHPDVAAALNQVAVQHVYQGRYAEAEPVYRRALEIREKALGPDHPLVGQSLNNLASLYRNLGNYEEAESLLRRAVALGERYSGPDDLTLAAPLANLAIIYAIQAQYSEAVPLFERALAITEKALGPDHRDMVGMLNGLANVYRSQGAYVKAEPLLQRALAIAKKALGPDHPDVATPLNNLAALYYEQGRYDEAEPLFLRSLALSEKAMGPDNPEIVGLVGNLAVLYKTQGHYSEAEPYYHRSLAIAEKGFGSDHPEVATALNNLANLFLDQSRYSEAEPLLQRALAIRDKAFGSDHPDVAAALNDLAILYKDQGRYAEAEPLFRDALRIWEKSLGPDHLLVANALHNLAILQWNQGNSAEAEPLFRRALSVSEQALGPDHPELAATVNSLAILQQQQGRLKEAEQLYQRALKLREKALGEDHPDVAESLNNLASLAWIEGRYEDAERLFGRALDIWRRAFGPRHPFLARALNSLGRLHMEEGKDAEAEAFADQAVEILDATTGWPAWRIEAYALRARLARRRGERRKAESDLAEALRSAEELRPEVGGGEETRAAFFGRYTDEYDRMVSWQLEDGDFETALEYVERGRARVLLDQLAAGKVDLRASIPSQIRTRLEKDERAIQARLAELQQRVTLVRANKELKPERRLQAVGQLEAKAREAQLEYQGIYDEIKNASPLWRDLLTSGGDPVSLSTIQRRVVPSDGLMLLYQIGGESSHCFLIPPVGGQPRAYPLELDSQVATVLGLEAGDLTSRKLDFLLTGSESGAGDGEPRSLDMAWGMTWSQGKPTTGTLRRLHALWLALVPEPIRAQILRSPRLLLLPDGALQLLPFESLVLSPPSDGQDPEYWLDKGPALLYAASATSLYNIQRRPPVRAVRNWSALSLSDPLYDPVQVAAAMRPETAGEGGSPPHPAQSRGSRSRDVYERAGGVLVRLPGTRRETAEIEKAFAGAAVTGIEVLTQLGASEPNLRHAIGGKRYVHLATHGLVGSEGRSLFSALALTPPAGGTTDSSDDGFLQLHEIYQLKLEECELAVLSACQTNVGNQIEGEGVFALSRGFLAAGARRVVASQWSVDDASTAALIGAFFRRIADAEKSAEKVDFVTALRDAKREIRNKEEWAAPYFWAPFVLTGKP